MGGAVADAAPGRGGGRGQPVRSAGRARGSRLPRRLVRRHQPSAATAAATPAATTTATARPSVVGFVDRADAVRGRASSATAAAATTTTAATGRVQHAESEHGASGSSASLSIGLGSGAPSFLSVPRGHRPQVLHPGRAIAFSLALAKSDTFSDRQSRKRRPGYVAVVVDVLPSAPPYSARARTLPRPRDHSTSPRTRPAATLLVVSSVCLILTGNRHWQQPRRRRIRVFDRSNVTGRSGRKRRGRRRRRRRRRKRRRRRSTVYTVRSLLDPLAARMCILKRSIV